MNDLQDNQGQGVLYVSGTRGYSAYEVAVQNGFVGTEQEWLDSLVGPQGEPGTPFDELTEEQKAEIRGEEGKSAYDIAVENGFIGTEQDWVNSFLTPDGYYNKDEMDEKIITMNTYNKLSLKRIMRTLERNSNHPEYESGVDYATMQGGTYIGNNKMIVARIRNNTQNDTLLQEISLDTGVVTREKKLSLAHANSVTYNPKTNKLYVTSLILNIESVNTQLKELYVINYNDLTLDTTITFTSLTEGEGVHSVSYDIVTNKYYLATEDVLHNNKLTLYEMNITTYELTKINLLDDTGLLSTTNNNDILVYNNIFYLLKFSPQVIVTYDLETLKLRNIYNIDNVTEVGNTVGEIENISVKYDTDLKNLVISTNHIECTNGFYNMFQYFECNPIHNIENLTSINRNNLSRSVYVDAQSTSINPTGTSGNKFKTINEALELAQVVNGGLRITLGPGEYSYVNFQNSKGNIIITGNGSNRSSYIINGIKIFMCNQFYITGITINNTSTSQVCDLYCQDSNVRLSVIDMNSDIDYHIYARSSTIEFLQIYHTNALFYCQSEPNLICYDDKPKYKVLNQIPNVNKPIILTEYLTITSTSNTVSYEGNETLLEDINSCLMFSGYGYFSYGSNTLKGRNNDGNRTFTLILHNHIIRIKIDWDTTNKTLTFTIISDLFLSANGITDNTSSASVKGILYFCNNLYV